MLTYLLSIATCHRNLEVDLPSRLQTDTPLPQGGESIKCVWVS